MAFLNVEIYFQIYDSYSLKDKRSTVKSIVNRMSQRYNASLAEIGKQDLLNVGHVGIAIVNSSALIARQTLDQMLKEIEESYEIEIFETIYKDAESGDNDIIHTSTSEPASESVSQVVEEEKTIRFLSGVTDNFQTRGDMLNYYAIEGKADGFERVTAIIEGTAVDIRNTDDQWNFTYPYPGPNVETEITFTTDQTIEYGQTGIDINKLEPETYITLTFIPNSEPEIEQPSVTTKEGQPHTFRNSDSTIVEIVTVMSIELVDSKEADNSLGDQLLKVVVQYVNDGTVMTHIAPNYFSALDGDGHFLPLRYSHFWLVEVASGQSFTETIYFDVTDEGPYSIQFFDGAWEHSDGITGTAI